MGKIQMKEARQRFSELVDAASRGETIVITRRGRSVARLGPVEPAVSRPFPDLAAFRATVRMKGRPLSKTVIALRAEERY